MWQLHLLPEEKIINMSLIHLLLGHVCDYKVLMKDLLTDLTAFVTKQQHYLLWNESKVQGGIIQKVYF